MKRSLYLSEQTNYVLHLLNTKSRVTTEEVGEKLHIASSTVRKLLASMEQKGLLIRTYGGAISLDANRDAPLAQKALLNVEKKRAIARCARKYVKNGSRIAVAGGSTLLEFCRCLHDLKDAVVLTNSINAANILMANHNIEVQICAGIIRERTGCIVGWQAMSFFEEASVDMAFIGTDGVDPDKGIWSNNLLIGNAERYMAKAAKKVFVLCDDTKMGQTSIQPILPFSDVDYIITNEFTDDTFIEQIEKHGCQVVFSK